jgi:hypothetical protein
MEKDQEVAALKKRLNDLAQEIDGISRQLGWIAEGILRTLEPEK